MNPSPKEGFLADTPRNLFFTGKGGVGKTSLACATALALTERGYRVLLVSTDPASNLDEVLETRLNGIPSRVNGAASLWALNIDPEEAAREYRERLVAPYRGILPPAAVASMEEQLSGACTVEIAAFNEFSRLLGDRATTESFDRVVFDTAPTGHTLRLLELPGAWNDFLESGAGGTSCLGPLSGLKAQKTLYEETLKALLDREKTLLVLVSRPETTALREAERTRAELAEKGISRIHLFLNGLFHPQDPEDPVAHAFAHRGQKALAALPEGLAELPRSTFPLLPRGALGLPDLGHLWTPEATSSASVSFPSVPASAFPTLGDLLEDLETPGHGVILTMGKGGVGKTTLAQALAVGLASRGHRVRLSTTDPAAHLTEDLGYRVPHLSVDRIDPRAERDRYVAEVLETQGSRLDAQGRALLEEDLRSPCTEEIAVFRAFAETVEAGEEGFVVLDTAPTGHTLLLLDATEAYHQQVSRTVSDIPDSVRRLLPRLRDETFTQVLVVALPEATPVHEAAQLQKDLARAGIRPKGWILNQSLIPLEVRDPVLGAKRASEFPYLEEVLSVHAPQVALVSWTPGDLSEPEALRGLLRPKRP